MNQKLLDYLLVHEVEGFSYLINLDQALELTIILNKKNLKKAEKDPKAIFSLGFILATIGNIFLCFPIVILLLASPLREVLGKECLIAYSASLFSAVVIVTSTKMEKFRTIIHEIKHAVVVKLTGNKLKKIVAESGEGYVEYQMYKDQVHFAPLIALAPYFFPLLSLPGFICVALYDTSYPVQGALALGFLLGADICFGIGEIHPHQTDFKQVVGGAFFSKLYLVGFYILWPSLITLWVKSGITGIQHGILFVTEHVIKSL